MLRFIQSTLVLMLGITLAGCNRSTVQPAPVPSVPTSTPVDRVPPAQNTDVRIEADRRDVDVKVDRPGILGDRKVEVDRDANGNINVHRETSRDRDDRPLRDRNIDVQVVPGQGVKVDLDK